MLPPVFVVPWLDPNGELEPKSPPAEAPVEAGVPKENPLDMFVEVLDYQMRCVTEERNVSSLSRINAWVEKLTIDSTSSCKTTKKGVSRRRERAVTIK
jgi:hypothetical protein